MIRCSGISNSCTGCNEQKSNIHDVSKNQKACNTHLVLLYIAARAAAVRESTGVRGGRIEGCGEATTVLAASREARVTQFVDSRAEASCCFVGRMVGVGSMAA